MLLTILGRSRRTALAMTAVLTLALMTAVAGDRAGADDGPFPYQDPSLSTRDRVTDLLARMTTAEKLGQMTQAERTVLVPPEDIAAYGLGSILSSGSSNPTPNTAQAWADMIDGFQAHALNSRLGIPLLYGADAVHGHAKLYGATVMPHNIGLGATRDPALTAETYAVTAEETRATGVAWDFAPCLCVVRDDRWGRTYESFGEDPALVSSMATTVDALQGTDLADATSVLATAKHYVGDGGTTYGSSTTGNYTIDQGVTEATPEELWAVHIAPFAEAVERGVGSVMPSFSSVDFVGDDEGPVKMHARADLIAGTLKGELGFDGFVISDFAAIDQIPGDYASDVRTSINAGLDMIMVPYDYKGFLATLTAEVEAGRIPMARIDDAVSRILAKKFELGLFERPYADRTHMGEIGSAEHRAVARDAAAASQVLLKNGGGLLPLDSDVDLYLAGRNADDLGHQAGGWTIIWQGGTGDVTVGTTVREGIAEVAPDAAVTFSPDASAPTEGHDVGVVVVGEGPYAEGRGDVGVGVHTMKLSDVDAAAIDAVCGAMDCAVVVVSGRPLEIDAERLGRIDALVAAWLPGSEGAGVAEPLFGERPFTGRLPVSWPRLVADEPVNVGDEVYDPLFAYGWGLRTDSTKQRLAEALDALDVHTGDRHVRAAAEDLEDALVRPLWTKAGEPRRPGEILRLVARAASRLEQSSSDVSESGQSLVTVARDLAQTAIVANAYGPVRAVSLTADADHKAVSGEPFGAVRLLYRAYRLT